jgi:hypothetical protein
MWNTSSLNVNSRAVLVGLDEPIGREDGYPANSSFIEELEYPFGITRALHYRL